VDNCDKTVTSQTTTNINIASDKIWR